MSSTIYSYRLCCLGTVSFECGGAEVVHDNMVGTVKMYLAVVPLVMSPTDDEFAKTLARLVSECDLSEEGIRDVNDFVMPLVAVRGIRSLGRKGDGGRAPLEVYSMSERSLGWFPHLWPGELEPTRHPLPAACSRKIGQTLLMTPAFQSPEFLIPPFQSPGALKHTLLELLVSA